MDWTVLQQLADKYGLGIAASFYVLIRDVIPLGVKFISKYVLPGNAKKQQAELDSQRKILDNKLALDAEETRARIQEREWRHDMDERQQKTLDELSKATIQNSELLAVLNERQAQMVLNLNTFSAHVLGGMDDMRQAVATFHGPAGARSKGRKQ